MSHVTCVADGTDSVLKAAAIRSERHWQKGADREIPTVLSASDVTYSLMYVQLVGCSRYMPCTKRQPKRIRTG